MQTRSLFNRSGRTSAMLAIAALACFAAGCTETETDTPPEEHHGPPHSIMRIGSTEDAGGELAVDTIPTAFVVASACLGGTGDECAGGTIAYTGDSPGFNSVTTGLGGAAAGELFPRHDGPLHKLPDGVEVRLEIIDIEPDASLLISGTLLDSAGQIGVINTTPELHNHPTWQIVAPGGTVPPARTITFRLIADGFEPSDEITVTIQLFEENAPPTPTPTPEEHEGPPHTIMEVGSTVDGSGTLTVNDVPTAFVVETACLGGTGAECSGGTIAYTGDSPGFNDVRTEEEGFHALADGTQVSIEITAIDPDASVLISGVLLDTVGATAVVNTSPELHNHPTWQIVAPGGAEVEDKDISFRLHAAGYTSSDEITVTISKFEDHDDDDDDDDDEDEDD